MAIPGLQPTWMVCQTESKCSLQSLASCTQHGGTPVRQYSGRPHHLGRSIRFCARGTAEDVWALSRFPRSQSPAMDTLPSWSACAHASPGASLGSGSISGCLWALGHLWVPRVSLGLRTTLGPGVSLSPGATLGPGASLSPGASLGPGVFLGPGASLGPGMSLSPGATLGPGVSLGLGVFLGPGASLGQGWSLGPGVSLGPGASLGPGWSQGPGACAFSFSRQIPRQLHFHPVPIFCLLPDSPIFPSPSKLARPPQHLPLRAGPDEALALGGKGTPGHRPSVEGKAGRPGGTCCRPSRAFLLDPTPEPEPRSRQGRSRLASGAERPGESCARSFLRGPAEQELSPHIRTMHSCESLSRGLAATKRGPLSRRLFTGWESAMCSASGQSKCGSEAPGPRPSLGRVLPRPLKARCFPSNLTPLWRVLLPGFVQSLIQGTLRH